MDISLEKKKTSLVRRYWYVPAVVIALAGVFFVKQMLGGVSYVVDANLVRVAKVQKGEFFVDVRSNGELSAKEIHWIPAEVSGHIDMLYAKEGDEVTIGSPLLKMRNPELHAELEKAQWEYKQAKAESFASIKALESDLLQLESESLRAQLAYKGNDLKMKAEKKLIALGQGIVSEVDHQRTVFSVQEQYEIWQFYKKRIQNMRENIDAQQRAEDARVARLKNDLDQAQREVDSLTVRSRSKGLVQEIDLELGQKLDIGDTIARVADTSELIAELKVQELQVQRVSVGQEVIIDTRKNKLKGKVKRVHPSVTNGMVQVDVDFVEPLTPETRIALSVEGSIRTYSVPSTLFVRRPAFAQQNATVGIYKVNSDGYQAKRQPVKLGLSSVNHVQILGGLSEGDQIIISDTSAHSEHETVLLN